MGEGGCGFEVQKGEDGVGGLGGCGGGFPAVVEAGSWSW